jgi:hypothetical protein
MTLSDRRKRILDVFADDEQRVWVDIDGQPLAEYVPKIERDRLAEALREIRDHGTEHGHECWALHRGDCADVFQEIARAALGEDG